MKGWLAITLFVLGYDMWAGATDHPTLSTTYRTLSRTHRVPALFLSAYVVSHLHGYLPGQYDPLVNLGRAYGGRLGGIRTHDLPDRTRLL